jgi:hypothetical protein
MVHKIKNQAKGWVEYGHVEYKHFTGKELYCGSGLKKQSKENKTQPG